MKFSLKSISTYPAPARLGIFILFLALLWLPLAVPLHFLLVRDENLRSIVTMGILYGEFLFLLRFWGRKIHGLARVFRHYGLTGTGKNAWELLRGLALGLGLAIALFLCMVLFGWGSWQVTEGLGKIIAEGVIMALAIAVGEELLFRGWFLDELERDYSEKVSLWLNGFIFASLHFIKPLAEMIRTLPQFPGLLLLGLILVWGKRQHQNRLGFSIGIHGGLVWGYYIVAVGNLIEYRDRVSPWITGVDRNPLAGFLGLFFLGILAISLHLCANSKQK